MTSLVNSASDKAVSLSHLACEINAQHDRAIRHATSALEHARRAGELLQQAKQQLPHGQWIGWLSDNCDVSPRQAQRYMKVADNWLAITKNDAASYLTIDDAISQTSNKTKKKSREDWTAKIEALPEGQALYGSFRHGFTIIFRSSRHAKFYHCYSYFISYEFDRGEAQETKRPISAAGVALFMEEADMSFAEFIQVDDSGVWENDMPGTLPYSQDFYRQLRGEK